jgi:hypothetical protein
MRCFVVARGRIARNGLIYRKCAAWIFLVFFLFPSPFSLLVVQPGKAYPTNPGLDMALCPAVREGEQQKKTTTLAINHCPFFNH